MESGDGSNGVSISWLAPFENTRTYLDAKQIHVEFSNGDEIKLSDLLLELREMVKNKEEENA